MVVNPCAVISALHRYPAAARSKINRLGPPADAPFFRRLQILWVGWIAMLFAADRTILKSCLP
jgi:hypothetical protein